MYVCLKKIPKDLAVLCFDPDTVMDLINSQRGQYWTTFVDDGPNIPIEQELTSISVNNEGCLFLAKSKSTMLDAFRSGAGDKNLSSTSGVLVLAHGNYGQITGQRIQLSIMTKVPFLTRVTANALIRRHNRQLDRSDGPVKPHSKLVKRAEQNNRSTRAMLMDRGYFVFAVGRTAFNNPPPNTSLTYVGDYRANFTKVATLIKHGKDV